MIVSVDADPEVLEDMAAHARLGLERFHEWPGFRSGTLYRSENAARLIQLTEWESATEYERCRDDPIWDTLLTTGIFFGHVHAGRARVDARVFTAVAVARRA